MGVVYLHSSRNKNPNGSTPTFLKDDWKWKIKIEILKVYGFPKRFT